MRVYQLFLKCVEWLCLRLLNAYQWITSPLPHRCRFYPSCSSYMMEAIQCHGVLHGLWLGCSRLLRCHPFHPGGVDKVPDRTSV